MTRRFTESQMVAKNTATSSATPHLPGFVACSISSAPTSMQQLWQAFYQTAFHKAVMAAMLDAQPTRYQRLVYNICAN